MPFLCEKYSATGSACKRLNKHIANLQKSFTINDYKKYIDWFGKEVVLRTDKESYTATALDVTADGRLVVSRDGKIIEISSAEVSLRL